MSGQPSFEDALTRVEEADSPLAAIDMASHVLRRVITLPLEIGRDAVKIVLNGDTERAVRAAADTKF